MTTTTSSYETIISDYETLREDAGAVFGERDVVKISGPDALSYLDGQLSQDIAALELGESAWSFILQPTGKVDVYCRVFRVSGSNSEAGSNSESTFFIEVPVGCGEATLTRLQRFKLRVDCELELLRWQICSVRGPKSAEIDMQALPSLTEHTLVAPVEWGDVTGFDLLNPSPLPIRECSTAALEVLRIEAGIPQMSQDIMEGAIPAEVGNRILDKAVSFTKGCYVGQELVARIDSRGGNVPRRLLGVISSEVSSDTASPDSTASPDDTASPDNTAVPNAGEPLFEAAEPARQIGTLTSFVKSPRLGSIGLALIHRSVGPSGPSSIICGNLSLQIVDLPFPPSL